MRDSPAPAPNRAIRVARPASSIKVSRPEPPKPALPVEFRADRISSREEGEGKDRRRVTVAHGNVYVAQGNPDSEMFLEMRAGSAVVFS